MTAPFSSSQCDEKRAVCVCDWPEYAQLSRLCALSLTGLSFSAGETEMRRALTMERIEEVMKGAFVAFGG